MANPSGADRRPINLAPHALPNHAIRAVDYLRISTEEQKLGYGIASQGRKNARYIELRGWTHVGTYKDEGVSGSKEMGERLDFGRLMESARHGEFDLVVVESGDRIGRVGRAFWRWVWALEDIGIFVAIVNQHIDSTTPEGRSQMRRLADYAENEWETIRSRTQGGLQEKAQEEGSPHIGGKPPFGYRIEGKGTRDSYLVIDESEARIVRRVYDMAVAGGLNLRQIAVRLNSEGITSRSGRPWSPANLRDRIMSRAVLDGQLIFRGEHAATDADGEPLWGESVTIVLPRVLTEEEAATLRRRISPRAKNSNRKQACYPLSGRLIGLCNAKYVGISRESVAYGRRSYRCSGKNDAVVCTCSYVDAQTVESHVWSEVVRLLDGFGSLQQLAAESASMPEGDPSAHEERIARLDRQIEDMNASIAAVLVASAEQRQSPDAIAAATKVLNDELQQLEEMRTEAAAWLAEIEEAGRRADAITILGEMARHQLVDMSPIEQGQVFALLDVKVFIEGPVPPRRRGVACTVRDWYRSADLEVPARDLSDEQWDLIAALLPEGRRGRARRSVEAIFAKARTGAAWSGLRDEYGSTSTASKYFTKWVADGTWARVNAVLSDVERCPLPMLDLVLPLRIEGRMDPRVTLIP